MDKVERFDFDRHYTRIEQAANDAEITTIRQEYTAYLSALNETEKTAFRRDFNEYLRRVNDRADVEIALLKEILSKAQVA